MDETTLLKVKQRVAKIIAREESINRDYHRRFYFYEIRHLIKWLNKELLKIKQDATTNIHGENSKKKMA